MSKKSGSATTSSSLRQRILTFVGGLILLSLLGSTISLYRISEVNRSLDAINRVSVPLGRLFAQMQADVEVFRREADRRLGYPHWKDTHWRPRPIPRWIEEVIQNELERARELISREGPWADSESKKRWREWIQTTHQGFEELRVISSQLHGSLEKGDEAQASSLYPGWASQLENLARQMQWGVDEYDRSLRHTFSSAQSRVKELRTGLELILIVVISFSLLLLWLGERALRPMNELTRLAREITRRGLRKEDKTALPEIPLTRNDEVSQLAREFHHMATALLEREKTVEMQKDRLEEQNKLLRDMGELNQNILSSIHSILIVVDLQGRITQCNPVASAWLVVSEEELIGSLLTSWPKLRAISALEQANLTQTQKVEPVRIEDRVYGGQLMPLRHEQGAILVLEDLTDDLDLQERLRRAENLAAIGRMSAQVAHEVRNPLHSIGLEAELAAEMAGKTGDVNLKQSLQSILAAVDRLEKITENYLKLSRLSSGKKEAIDLGLVLESVLATYASVCEAQGVKVNWSRERKANLKVWGDRDLLEQVLGNLLRNSLQALEADASSLLSEQVKTPNISFALGNTETGRVWVRISDNGPGVAPELQEKLFTPFVTTKAQGTGLGLSFVKKVIEEHGGTVEYRDRIGSRGASFEIVLPSGEAGAAVAVNSDRPEMGQPFVISAEEVSTDASI